MTQQEDRDAAIRRAVVERVMVIVEEAQKPHQDAEGPPRPKWRWNRQLYDSGWNQCRHEILRRLRNLL